MKFIMKITTFIFGFSAIPAVFGMPSAIDPAGVEALAKRAGARCKDTSVPCSIDNGIANCILCEYIEVVNGVTTTELDWICLGVQLGILADPCS